jgi:excinuclease UvrABC ATPase subunit
LFGATSIATISNTISQVRDLYKKKNGKLVYSLSSENSQCNMCGGSGYYEINTGALGIIKRPCPECGASGFSAEILGVTVGGKSIADVQNMKLSDVRLWLNNVGLRECDKNLSVFERLGLSNLQYCRAINDVSYSQATLMLIGRFILGQEEGMVLKNAFLNISQPELEFIQAALDELCGEYRKTVTLVLPE